MALQLGSVEIIAIIIFLAAIMVVITGWFDSVIAALLGVVAMICFGVMTDIDAFTFVDWNVIAILISIWTISGFFGRSGVPAYLSAVVLKMSRGNVALFVVSVGALAGIVSMLIDNVVVVLMFAPVIFHACRRFKLPAFGPVLFMGLCANFMGTALLLEDLPSPRCSTASPKSSSRVFSGLWAGPLPSSSC